MSLKIQNHLLIILEMVKEKEYSFQTYKTRGGTVGCFSEEAFKREVDFAIGLSSEKLNEYINVRKAELGIVPTIKSK